MRGDILKANMSENFVEHWNIVRISRVDNILRPQDVPDDESFEEKHTKASLEYLLKKGQLMHHDIAEELIFYPELYGICPPYKHNNCLNLKEDSFLLRKVEYYIKRTTRPDKRTPILRYIHEYNFVEIYLDNLQLRSEIPKKIFLCKNLRVLSLRGNRLRTLPADIGRLKNLEELYLSNNSLNTNSLPFTLTFCHKLHTLFLDNNRFTSLPGFLLQINSLVTLRRQSNHTSFRKMFIIHKSNRIDKIKPVGVGKLPLNSYGEVSSLQKLAANVIITQKIDYFSLQFLPTTVQNAISRYYPECIICDNCTAPKFQDTGYEVSTHRYGHLGNYWSVFLYKACSRNCAEQLHKFSLELEQSSLAKLDEEYNEIVANLSEKIPRLEKTEKCCSLF